MEAGPGGIETASIARGLAGAGRDPGGGIAVGLGYKDRKDASVWLERLEAADIAKLPELIAERDSPGPGLSGPLSRLFVEGAPLKKLKAALALAPSRGDCAEYAYGRLLEASAEEVAPIARALKGRMVGLVSNLEKDTRPAAAPNRQTSQDTREADDRRRANAAAALVVIGQHDAGLRLLRFDPDPQAHSFLIHGLGPAGVAPHVLLERLIDPETETSIRRALIQALGEIPAAAWDPAEQGRALATVRDLFRDDPDSGIHGSARWLLRKWEADLSKIEGELKLAGPRAGFRWRVSRFGLTFVTVNDPETGRVIELSDTEVPCGVFLGIFREHQYRKESSPEPDCPITEISYLIAAKFCNELTDRDGMRSADRCYGAVSKLDVEPVAGALDRAGYRIPTDSEFRLACRGGTITRRYHGDSTELLPRYAWYDQRTTMRTHPVGRLKPNEFGLFDTLGNVREVCHASQAPDHSLFRAVMCGGSVKYPEFDVVCDRKLQPTVVHQRDGILDVGIRVARTIMKR